MNAAKLTHNAVITNEHLQERFSRSRRRRSPSSASSSDEEPELPQPVNMRIREYFNANSPFDGVEHAEPWLLGSEIPTSAEMRDVDESGSSSSEPVEIPCNKPWAADPWRSTEEYLSAHYELLREDAIKPLRDTIASVFRQPLGNEQSFAQGKTMGFYDKVHICGITASPRGIAHRVTFGLGRVGKKIIWEQSKRLLSGSLVVLTPASDMFRSIALVATVAGRPLDGLRKSPPEIDIFFARPEEYEIDPDKEFVMVEERNGYFEAQRHLLLALQRMTKETFPLHEYIVGLKTSVGTPDYIAEMVRMNQKCDTMPNYVQHHTCWPRACLDQLNSSQREAFHRLLEKAVAVIQGPPGTGKTHVSVKAIQALLSKWQPGDPPIIISSQTNHALDQLLRHIAKFETNFIRLGGQSKDSDVIRKRTLYEVRTTGNLKPPLGCLASSSRRQLDLMKKEFRALLLPISPSDNTLDHRMLEKCQLLTKAQANSLEAGASQWVLEDVDQLDRPKSAFAVWLGDKLVRVPYRHKEEDYGFDFEEVDEEFEQLQELEAEAAVADDHEYEKIGGEFYDIADSFTARRQLPNANIKSLMRHQNLWDIPEASRGAVYRHLQHEFKASLLRTLRDKAKKYNAQTRQLQIGRWEMDENILKRCKIIGVTTSGFSKYRGLLSALQPRFVLIEEAAELLEVHVTAMCVPSLQHLALVGDHKQLPPRPNVKEHEGEPYCLDLSLFERLVQNNVEFSVLNEQRRMIPEIRRLLYPTYKDLITDHPQLLDPDFRPNVPGMGGINSFFFSHSWPDERDHLSSHYNSKEADMIVGFFEYLVRNGVQVQDITVLTFYHGQRKNILRKLRSVEYLNGGRGLFSVSTIDAYQGEENRIIILSLVRSNAYKSIGFLASQNRANVALSRAQCGLYIFGNSEQLQCAEKPLPKDRTKHWTCVIKTMAAKKLRSQLPKMDPERVKKGFPVVCLRHNRRKMLTQPSDWESLKGGCGEVCSENLSCGHDCQRLCEPPIADHQHRCTRCVVTQDHAPTPSAAAVAGCGSPFAARGEQQELLIAFDQMSVAQAVVQTTGLRDWSRETSLLD